MHERLPFEHFGEVLADPLEYVLYGRAVGDEGGGHVEIGGRDAAHGGLDVVGDPLHEVGGLPLRGHHLLVDLLHGHVAPEHGGEGEVPALAGVGGGHEVAAVEHLAGELGHGAADVVLAARGDEGREPHQKEVQAREGHHVDAQLPQVGVELAGEAETGGDPAHDEGDEAVELLVAGVPHLEGVAEDLVQSLVVDHEGCVGVLHQLVDGEGRVVGLHHRVRGVGAREHGEGGHHPVGVLLPDLRDEEGAEARPRAPPQRVGHLEALQALRSLRLPPHHLHHRVHDLRALRVVPLRPVVARARLPEHVVVRAEQVPHRTALQHVHRTRLQIDQHRTRHVLLVRSLVEVHVYLVNLLR